METSNIFEALYDYYNRNEHKMPKMGLSNGIAIGNVVVIDKDGKYVRDYRNYELDENGKVVVGKDKNPLPKRYDNAPFDIQVTSGVKAHLLYGQFEYFFPTTEGKKNSLERNKAFVNEVKQAFADSSNNEALGAILKFYENGEYADLLTRLLNEAQKEKDKKIANAKNDAQRKKAQDEPLSSFIHGNFSFQIDRENGIVIEDENLHGAFVKYYQRQQSDNFSGYGMDSITGEYGRLISVFPGKSMQATLIGFNTVASNSHGYNQMGNCPMTLDTAMKIASAFAYLMHDRKHNIKIGSAVEVSSLVFWSSSNDVNVVSDDELESDLFRELAKLSGSANNADKSESKVAEKENYEKVHSIFKGTRTYEHEKNSTYYVATISCPDKGTIYVSRFESGKIGDLYDNLEKYQNDFRTKFENNFVAPWKVLEACYKRGKDGKAVKGEADSKNHIKMKRNLLMSAIFGGEYEDQTFAEIIDRIYREGSLEYKYVGGVNKGDRIACVRAYASQSHVIDEFKFEKDLENLPYQIGSFYGVCEAIRHKYSIATNRKPNDIWKIYNNEFKKGLVNQTNEFIVNKLKTQAKVLAGYLDKNEERRLVGDYSKEQVWTTERKPNGVIRRHGEWKITHDDDKSKWGEIDWAIWRMEKLAGQAKSNWSLDDKAMYLLGFYRMFKGLTYKN